MKIIKRKYIVHEHPLKTKIYKMGMNVEQFAAYSQVSCWTLSRIFRERCVPRGDTLYQLAKALEMDYEELKEFLSEA